MLTALTRQASLQLRQSTRKQSKLNSTSSPSTRFLTATKNHEIVENLTNRCVWSDQFSYTTPESDFTSDIKYDIMDHIDKNDLARSSIAYSLSFIENENNCVSHLFTDEMKLQLANVNLGYQRT